MKANEVSLIKPYINEDFRFLDSLENFIKEYSSTSDFKVSYFKKVFICFSVFNILVLIVFLFSLLKKKFSLTGYQIVQYLSRNFTHIMKKMKKTKNREI